MVHADISALLNVLLVVTTAIATILAIRFYRAKRHESQRPAGTRSSPTGRPSSASPDSGSDSLLNHLHPMHSYSPVQLDDIPRSNGGACGWSSTDSGSSSSSESGSSCPSSAD